MRALIALSLLLFACGEEDTDDKTNEDHAICGEVVLEDDWCGMPDQVDVYTILDGATACDDSDLWDDTGGDEEWEPWYDESVAQPSVGEDGTFHADALDAGEYAVRYLYDCYGCATVTVVDGECAEVTLALTEVVTVDAPNVYLYPPEPTGIRVRLPAPDLITASEPLYPRGGWFTVAHPDGLLETQAGARDFLFYELAMDPRQLHSDAGWCVPGHQAQASIEHAMADMGFLQPEIHDFSDFWDPVFPEDDWLSVRPLTQDLPGLGISPAPEHLLRAWFVVEPGCASDLEEPRIQAVPRTGYHAAEWGVALVDLELDRDYVSVSGLAP